MIALRLGDEVIRLEPEEWEIWVQDGRVPPEAQLWIEGSGWVPVGMVPAYRRLREGEPRRGRQAPEVFAIAFPRRGLSATEVLVLANLLVAGALAAIFGAGYLAEIRRWTTGAWFELRDQRAVWWWLPTLFLHAGPRHLFANMLSLLATAAAVEFLMGKRWVYAVYLIAGLGGMWLSYAGHARPPLSIGASGAIFGLGGACAAFVLRRRRAFTYRQRWKAGRVYGPLLLFLILPSVLHADYLGHLGGLLTGFLLGLFIPPHPRLMLDKERGLPPRREPSSEEPSQGV